MVLLGTHGGLIINLNLSAIHRQFPVMPAKTGIQWVSVGLCGIQVYKPLPHP
jgi:hypothetical protein